MKDLYLLGVHMSDKKILGFLERVQGRGAWIALFHYHANKAYLGFCLQFFERVGFLL